jgi:hypothetical protein
MEGTISSPKPRIFIALLAAYTSLLLPSILNDSTGRSLRSHK